RWKRREVLELEEVDDCRMDSSVCRGGVQYCRGKRGRIQAGKSAKNRKTEKRREDFQGVRTACGGIPGDLRRGERQRGKRYAGISATDHTGHRGAGIC